MMSSSSARRSSPPATKNVHTTTVCAAQSASSIAACKVHWRSPCPQPEGQWLSGLAACVRLLCPEFDKEQASRTQEVHAENDHCVDCEDDHIKRLRDRGVERQLKKNAAERG